MKILFNRWYKARVNVSLIVYTKWMIAVYTNYSNVRKLGQWFWRKGQKFEFIVRIGRIQFTYTDYSIGGELIEPRAEEKTDKETERQGLVG